MTKIDIDFIGSEIADLTAYFEETGNVVAAWRAYSLSRQHNRPIADSVMLEVDRFATGVSAVAERAMQTLPDAPLYFTPEKLGVLWRGNGGQNPADALRRDWRDRKIGHEVWRRVESGEKVGVAIEAVAKGPPSRDTEIVRKAWQRFRRDG
ncbi:hypothetical protein G8O24_38680 [Bradyrhizobium sp. INPA01-394B]|uniref:Uncharacterized protein n=1 Tax=Bradyrhizobium campsiandrae TaxID=1729892 RepID=A0ABR7UF25_9BRAD|nr:hypothetical protein [Bradyrhizobium campsiandrae]MBC9883219.1 hypothetical protein [Bradyrhizobium campsiandrae]MBC9982186.1 hypothetical protein [Bradyrhizobium campsiandrae]